MLQCYDIISLNEVKTAWPVSFPGFMTVKSNCKGTRERGGTVILIRNWLSKGIKLVDTAIEDQVWLQFTFAPRVMFGFCYIPPQDSEYYSHYSFAAIQEKIKVNPNLSFCVVGDLNARLGKRVRELPRLADFPDAASYTYPILPDDVPLPNDNATILSALCIEEKLLVINNLKTPDKHFFSKKTYRKHREWISELDICIVSLNFLKNISNFSVIESDSLPSDHAPVSFDVYVTEVDLENLSLRAQYLGDHAALHNCLTRRATTKPVYFRNIDKDVFQNKLNSMDLPNLNGSTDDIVKEISDTLYLCASESKYERQHVNEDINLDRWNRLLSDNNDTNIWNAINWKGEYAQRNDGIVQTPSDEDFKLCIENALSTHDYPDLSEANITTGVTIPVLDELISPLEVKRQVDRLKVNKTSGPDGLCPGIFKLLSAQWILTLTSVFNMLFMSGTYPQSWCTAKLFTIYKKGDKSNPQNYRGINVINVMAKIYDMVLCCRLSQWFTPFREQAGAQVNRSCIEHIVTLRLLCDNARRKKYKLYVAFIDFTQAYDLVPRVVLFNVLKRLGCGAVMLAALIAMYKHTESVLGSTLVTVTLGVRQGSPTSCLLFIIFVNDLIMLMKQGCGSDGVLAWLHVLVLMDDTVVVATTRQNLVKKLNILQKYCKEYGMKVNQSKTKYFVVNGNRGETDSIQANELTVEWCDSYVYLGSPFTCDGNVSHSVRLHANSKLPHALKFVSFINKNNDVPFIVKRRVFEAALMSALLYGCESWVGADLRPVSKLYNWCLKQLLGVRRNVCNDLCYLEAGYPSLSDLVKHKQHKFIRNIWSERNVMNDDPLIHVIKIVLESNCVTSQTVHEYINTGVKDLSVARQELVQSVIDSNSSRRKVYKEINPQFTVTDIYTTRHTINETHRVAYTQFRLSGHSLVCETGRWNRRGRGRLPPEERFCACGHVQTETHVVNSCPLSQQLRETHGLTDLQTLFTAFTPDATCKIIFELLSLYR